MSCFGIFVCFCFVYLFVCRLVYFVFVDFTLPMSVLTIRDHSLKSELNYIAAVNLCFFKVCTFNFAVFITKACTHKHTHTHTYSSGSMFVHFAFPPRNYAHFQGNQTKTKNNNNKQTII